MSARACKAAIDCTGFIFHLVMTILLIITGQIKDKNAIDSFNDLKEKMQSMYDEWREEHINFNDDDG